MFKVHLLIKCIWLVSPFIGTEGKGPGESGPGGELPRDKLPPVYNGIGDCVRAAGIEDLHFKITDIAGKGEFVYVYSNAVAKGVDCTTVRFDKKEDKTNKHLYTSTVGTYFKNKKSKTFTYSIPLSGEGYMYEYISEKDKYGDDILFKVHVDNYDAKLGVISYTRCSDDVGVRSVDSRTVAVLASNIHNDAALKKAFEFVNLGNKKKLLNSPWKVNTTNCPKK